MVKPRSLSASAANTFELCPSRWGAESVNRTPNSNNSAADLGTSVHEALDIIAANGMMTDPDADLETFIKIYDGEYDKLFGSDISRLDEGRELCRTWWIRAHPITNKILSNEVKESFPIQVTWNEQQIKVPFNYIWDRCDELPDDEIEVVDYKTIAIPLSHDEMRDKIQVRAYGLAAQVKYPDAKRIWVTYDMLRHGDPVGVSFSREENVETYRYLQRLLLRVLDSDMNNLEEKVNDECRWCIRKQVCGSLRKHADVGGVHAITDVSVAAERRHKMQQVAGALKAAIDELDGFLMKHMKSSDLLEDQYGDVLIEVTAQGKRNVDPAQVKRLVPKEVWDDYGDTKISMAAFDKLMKDSRLDPGTRSSVKGLVTKNFGSPSIKTKTKKSGS